MTESGTVLASNFEPWRLAAAWSAPLNPGTFGGFRAMAERESEAKHVRTVVELDAYLAHGGDVNVRCNDVGWTMLHLAIEHQNHGLIRALVARGADLELSAVDGWYPLHHAADIDLDGEWQATHSLAGVDFTTTELLLELGANPLVRDADGSTVRDQVARYCVPGNIDASAMLKRIDHLLSRYGRT